MNSELANTMTPAEIRALSVEERIALAEHSDTPTRVFRILSIDTDPKVLRALARNRSMPRHYRTAHMLQAMNLHTREAEKDFMDFVYYRRKLKTPEVMILAGKKHMQYGLSSNRDVMTAHIDINPAFTDLMQASKDSYVRMKVATHTRNSDRLEQLSHDSESRVRIAVVGNAATPLDVLEQLSKDSRREVRSAVASNLRTPATALARLAKDTNSKIRVIPMRNPSTPDEVLTAATQDAITRVRKAARQGLRYRNEWLPYIEAKNQ